MTKTATPATLHVAEALAVDAGAIDEQLSRAAFAAALAPISVDMTVAELAALWAYASQWLEHGDADADEFGPHEVLRVAVDTLGKQLRGAGYGESASADE